MGLGQTTQTVKVDLYGDKRTETLSLVCYRNEDVGYFSQLVVNDSVGREIWRSPKADPRKGGPWAFGRWEYGTSDIQIAGDIDQDGHCEVVSPAPITDVRPTPFRVYRWNGKGLTYVRQACLIETSEGVFGWRENARDSKSYVSNFLQVDGDWVRVKVWRPRTSDGELRSGIAVLKPQDDHYTLVRWIEKIKI